MGRFSLLIFERRTLPERCIIYGGAYVPSRKQAIRALFDKWKFVKGHWIPYAFAKKRRREFLILFNIYGASMTLEALHLLKDGGVRKVFFIGSMFAKQMPIGTLVLPVKVIDRAGIVLVDEPARAAVGQDKSSVRTLELVLRHFQQSYRKAKIVSVPCVLHAVNRVREFVESNSDIEGVEMESSTFMHFSKKLGMKSFAALYVSDNKSVDVISGAKTVRIARRKALRCLTSVALRAL
jgi:purine-nucleoside phosphorylase